MRRCVAMIILGSHLWGSALAHAADPASDGAVPRASLSEATPRDARGTPLIDLEVVVDPLAEPTPVVPFQILDQSVPPGERVQISLELSESFTGGAVATPVQVIHGAQLGPTLCLVAGVHGDEIVGIEVVRRVVEHVDAEALRGTVVAVPIANPMGFRQSSRYLPDRRDLNRYFPGRTYGSSASRIAQRLFEGVIRHCDLVVDFHSGSFHRANLPQIRADLRNPILLAIANWFGAPVVVHSTGRPGTLRYAAVTEGIDAVLYEAGEPMRFDEESVRNGVRGVTALLQRMEMTSLGKLSSVESEIFRGSHWVRADSGGIFLANVELGAWVEPGDQLGAITNPFTNRSVDVRAREVGRVIGRAVDQVVTPGYALFHVGTIEASAERSDETEATTRSDQVENDERPE